MSARVAGGLRRQRVKLVIWQVIVVHVVIRQVAAIATIATTITARRPLPAGRLARTLRWRGRSVLADASFVRTLRSSGRSVGADAVTYQRERSVRANEASARTKRPQGWGILKTRGRAWTQRITLHRQLV